MNKFSSILSLVLVLSTTPAFSQTDKDSNCEVIGILAKSIMGARQSGVSMSDMMKTANESGALVDLQKALIIDAFELPRYSTEENQRVATEEFRDNATLACYKS